jgi:hypothetical protein
LRSLPSIEITSGTPTNSNPSSPVHRHQHQNQHQNHVQSNRHRPL